MAKDEIASKTTRWIVGIASGLIALLVTVFMVGWNVRGQTDHIKAVEVKTDTIRTDFNKHCEIQAEDTKTINNALGKLKENEAAQTVILQNIEKRLP